ncbi:PAS domain S-box protein [Candidatus Bathyarchaeota archaeon]|nr:PAS domain S-box protein [Candidatus Bathyarchaeota archaeon]
MSSVKSRKDDASSSIFQQVPGIIQEGFFKVNQDLVFTEVNDVLCQITGFTRDEILGTNLDTFLPHSLADSRSKEMKNMVREGGKGTLQWRSRSGKVKKFFHDRNRLV